MPQHRRALADLLRPRLKPPGFGDEAFLREFDAVLDAAGVPRDSEPPADSVITITAPRQPVPGVYSDPAAFSPAQRMIDAFLLKTACPERSLLELEPWVDPIRKACLKFEINTIRRVAAFIAQMAHESGLKVGREENLNYSAKRLTEVWPGRFPTLAAAAPYAHNPEKLANRVYANRMGNGDEASGDGWRFRGAGPGQLTGADNHRGFAKAMGMTVEQALAYVRTIEGGVMSFAWFWEENDINRLADTPGVSDETRRINGGEHGLADRTARFTRTVDEMLRREGAAT